MKPKKIINQIIPGLRQNETWNRLFEAILCDSEGTESIPHELLEEICDFLIKEVDVDGAEEQVVANDKTPYRDSVQRLRQNLQKGSYSEYLLDRLTVLLAQGFLYEQPFYRKEYLHHQPLRFYTGYDIVPGMEPVVRGLMNQFGYSIPVKVDDNQSLYMLKFNSNLPTDCIGIERGVKLCKDRKFENSEEEIIYGTVEHIQGNVAWVRVEAVGSVYPEVANEVYFYYLKRFKSINHHVKGIKIAEVVMPSTVSAAEFLRILTNEPKRFRLIPQPLLKKLEKLATQSSSKFNTLYNSVYQDLKTIEPVINKIISKGTKFDTTAEAINDLENPEGAEVNTSYENRIGNVDFMDSDVPTFGYSGNEIKLPIWKQHIYDEITWTEGSKSGYVIEGCLKVDSYGTHNLTIVNHTIGSTKEVEISVSEAVAPGIYWKYCNNLMDVADRDYRIPFKSKGWSGPINFQEVLELEVGKKVHLALIGETPSVQCMVGKRYKSSSLGCLYIDNYQEPWAKNLFDNNVPGSTVLATIYTLKSGTEWLRAMDWTGQNGVDIKVKTVCTGTQFDNCGIYISPDTPAIFNTKQKQLIDIAYKGCDDYKISGKVSMSQEEEGVLIYQFTQNFILDDNVIPLKISYKDTYASDYTFKGYLFLIPQTEDSIVVSHVQQDVHMPYNCKTCIIGGIRPDASNEHTFLSRYPYGSNSVRVSYKDSETLEDHSVHKIGGGIAWAVRYSNQIVTMRWMYDLTKNQRITYFINCYEGRTRGINVTPTRPIGNDTAGGVLGGGYYDSHLNSQTYVTPCWVQALTSNPKNMFSSWKQIIGNLSEDRGGTIDTQLKNLTGAPGGYAEIYPQFLTSADSVKVTTEIDPEESAIMVPNSNTGVLRVLKNKPCTFSVLKNAGWSVDRWELYMPDDSTIAEDITPESTDKLTCKAFVPTSDFKIKCVLTNTEVEFDILDVEPGSIEDSHGNNMVGSHRAMTGTTLDIRYVDNNTNKRLRNWELSQSGGSPINLGEGSPTVTNRFNGEVIRAILDQYYKLTKVVTGNGSISVTPASLDDSYKEGTEVKISATPDEHFRVASATLDGKPIELPTTVTMEANHTIDIAFEPAEELVLTLETNPTEVPEGSVLGSGTYAYGESVQIEALEVSGDYTFSHWGYEGIRFDDRVQNVVMTDNVTWTAYYLYTPEVQIGVNTEDSTKGTVSGSGTARVGKTHSVVATPQQGYMFSMWTDEEGVIVSYLQNFTFTVEKATTLTAHFVEKYEIGKVLLDDGSWVYPIIENQVDIIRLEIPQGREPIGVCVIPAAHTPENEDRVMSLYAMDNKNPEIGNRTGKNISLSWISGSGLNLKPGSISRFTRYDGTRNNLDNLVPCIAPYRDMTARDENTGLYYNASFPGIRGMAPVIAGEQKNPSYGLEGSAEADFDGEYNCQRRKTVYTDQPTWDKDEVISFAENKDLAPRCATRYCPGYTLPNDWYVPAIGELGYVLEFQPRLRNIFAALGISFPFFANYWTGNDVISSSYSGGNSYLRATAGSYNFMDYHSHSTDTAAPAAVAFMKVKSPNTPTHTFTVTQVEHGHVTGAGTFHDGRRITILAVPDKYYRFVGWIDANDQVIETYPDVAIELTVSENLSFKPKFEIITDTIEFSVGSGQGTVEPSGTVKVVEGTLIQHTATAAAHWKFSEWRFYKPGSSSYDASDKDNPNNYLAEGIYDRIKAVFEKIMFTIAVESTTGGTTRVNGYSSDRVQEGTQVTLTAVPSEGYEFVEWNDDPSTPGHFDATRVVTAEETNSTSNGFKYAATYNPIQ